AQATEVALNLMAQGRVPAEQLGQTMDAMTATFLNSKAELLGLAQAANYAVPELTLAGVPIEQQFAALGALAEGGQAGTRGARAVRQIFTTMKKIPFDKKKSALLTEFGVDLNKYFDKGVLKDLTGFIKTMGEANQRSGNSLFAQLFPANAITGIQTLVAQLETIDRVLKAIPNFKNANADLATEKFKGLTGAVRQLSSVWSELGIAFGESGAGKAVEGGIRRVSDMLTDLRNALVVGSFLEELFDPVALSLRVTMLAQRITSALMTAVVEAMKSALNSLSSWLGGEGTAGQWLSEKLGIEKLIGGLDTLGSVIDVELDARLQTVRDRVANRDLQKKYGAFAPEGYREFLRQNAGGIAIPQPLSMGALPTQNLRPEAIPRAEAQRIKVESEFKGTIEPLFVQFGKAIVEVRGNGGVLGSTSLSPSSNAPRGISTSEAGQVAPGR
ncbi:MAG: phage tail tape measure protein, partial [Hyphomicrobium sp.]